ncbi:MAG: hypothetical protein Q7J74_12965 [Pseudomonas sp.]|nr:hypothetical protein [Pseudomonas sp.]
MSNQHLIDIIKAAAEEHEYEIVGSDKKFSIFIDRYNAVAFEIWDNTAGYIQVHQWEGGDDESSGQYGRAVYSLRSVSDVVKFCNIMIASSEIRARRRT